MRAFRSPEAKVLLDRRFEVTGTFTLLGTSREISAVVENASKLAGKTSTRIKRSDFGMDYRNPKTTDEGDISVLLWKRKHPVPGGGTRTLAAALGERQK